MLKYFSFPLYEKLRDASPAPFSAFLDLDGRQVLSSSPELFLRMSGSSIRTRPIKGTRPRFRDPARDEKSAYDLLTSPKEIAEAERMVELDRQSAGAGRGSFAIDGKMIDIPVVQRAEALLARARAIAER